jgi:hypothetical protein
MRRAPLGPPDVEELARDRLEAVVGYSAGLLGCLARGARVDPLCQQLAGGCMPLASLLEADVGPDTERKKPLRSGEVVAVAPVLGAVLLQQQEEPMPVRTLLRSASERSFPDCDFS